MGAGGGGGGAVPPKGLSPLQQGNYDIGLQMIAENTPAANAAFSRYMMSEKMFSGALKQQRDFADQQADWARGGLMVNGMKQVKQGLNVPDLAPGMQERTLGRMGVGMTPEAQAAFESQRALDNTASKVGISNQARFGLAAAQRGMRFSGL
jgi:hypothetical protein